MMRLLALLLGFFSMLPGSHAAETPRAAATPDVLDAMLGKGAYLENCGLNVVLFCASYLGVQDSQGLLQSAPFGERSQQEASFKELIEHLRPAGLSCAAYKEASPQDVAGLLPTADRCAILQIRKMIYYHFVVVFRRGGQLGIYDYPKPVRYLTEEDFEKRFASFMTGAVLIASKTKLAEENAAPAAEEPAPVRKMEDKAPSRQPLAQAAAPTDPSHVEGAQIRLKSVLDAGAISPNRDLFTIPCTIENTGDQPLHVRGIVGACGCFQGPKNSFSLPPHSQKIVDLQFASQTFNQKAGTTLAIQSDDSKLPLCSFRVHCLAQETGPPARTALHPLTRVIDMGKIGAAQQENALAEFVILRDHEADRLSGPDAAGAAPNIRLEIANADQPFNFQDSVWYPTIVRVRLNGLKRGAFIIPIRVTSAGTDDPIDLTVRGLIL